MGGVRRDSLCDRLVCGLDSCLVSDKELEATRVTFSDYWLAELLDVKSASVLEMSNGLILDELVTAVYSGVAPKNRGD
jgi:Mn-dependent DtxR family transcriptional regulator